MKGMLFAALAALLFTGCVAHIGSAGLVRPMPDVALDLAVAHERLPDYGIAERPITMADGSRRYAVLFVHPRARATVLYFGGNGYRIGRFGTGTVEQFAKVPVNVVLVDHRGYGQSGGEAGIAGMLEDAPLVYDAVRAWPETAGLPLIVHGQSMGSFMAGAVARARTLDGLVLEGSVTTGREWGDYIADRYWLVRRADVEADLADQGNLPVMAGLDEPVLVLVGERDEATPPFFSQRLYDAAQVPDARKHLAIVPGRGHNDVLLDPSFPGLYAGFIDGLAPRTASTR
jgi:alpha-beta hydrolase superfamily lysophospholipase